MRFSSDFPDMEAKALEALAQADARAYGDDRAGFTVTVYWLSSWYKKVLVRVPWGHLLCQAWAMSTIPDPTTTMPNEYGTTVFLKNIVKGENIIVGDYTYYDDSHDPMGWERNSVLFNYKFFGEKLIIGRYCCLAEGSTFIMGAANHRLSSVTTYPFSVMGGLWRELSTPHIDELPHKATLWSETMSGSVWTPSSCLA